MMICNKAMVWGINIRGSPLLTYLLALAAYGALMLMLMITVHHTMQEHSPGDVDHQTHMTRFSEEGWLRKAEDFYQHLAQVQTHCRKMVRFGGSYCKKHPDNDKYVCLDKGVALHPRNCLVYSFGVGDDTTFDDAASKYGCEVFMFDPSLNETLQREIREDLLPRQHYYPIGLTNATQGQTIVLDRATGKTMTMDMVTYDDIKRRLGHSDKVVHYLKMDIEGYEWQALEYMFERGLLDGVQQLSMEIHTKDIIYIHQEWVVSRLLKYWKTLRKLEDFGFQRVFYRDNPVLESVYHVPEEPGKLLATCAELLYLRK